MFILLLNHVVVKVKPCVVVENKCATNVVKIIMMAHAANLGHLGLLFLQLEIILRIVQDVKVEFSKCQGVITVFVHFASMYFAGSARRISKA